MFLTEPYKSTPSLNGKVNENIKSSPGRMSDAYNIYAPKLL